jgi:hypothetical protein
MGDKFDFSGIATAYNQRCADGLTIKPGAFRNDSGRKVPLVWNHQHDKVSNVLGHAILDDEGNCVRAYCKFNNSAEGQAAKIRLQNGDIDALSIYANKLQKNGSNVMHGVIREVSLVLAGANPGAVIDKMSIVHSMGFPYPDEVDLDTIDEAYIYHSDEDEDLEIYDDEDDEDEYEDDDEEDLDEDDEYEDDDDEYEDDDEEDLDEDDEYEDDEDLDEDDEDVEHSGVIDYEKVFNSMNDSQKALVFALAEETGATDEKEDNMKHHIFEDEYVEAAPVATREMQLQILKDMKRFGSLKEAIKHNLEDEDGVLAHAYPHNEDGTEQRYGIANIDWLFPDARNINNGAPDFIKRDMDWVDDVMNGTKHTPFSRVKMMFADITEDEARAKGYVKGNQKIEEVFTLLRRTIDPQTVYKKQKLDRDDIVDITGFDVVSWIRQEMRMMLNEEIARAILIGDGRSGASPDKISEDHIKPIYNDADLFTIKVRLPYVSNETPDARAKRIINAAIRARIEYKGSGNPIFFTTAAEHTEMLLIDDGIGHSLYKTDSELATKLRARKIVDVPVMENVERAVTADGTTTTYTLEAIIVNLSDYNVGTDRGGEINSFDDFDIDVNQFKYLIETRCSGALVRPKSAIVIEVAKAPVTGG